MPSSRTACAPFLELHRFVGITYLGIQVVYPVETREQMVKLLREHIQCNLVKVRLPDLPFSLLVLTQPFEDTDRRPIFSTKGRNPTRLGSVELALQLVLRPHGVGHAPVHARSEQREFLSSREEVLLMLEHV